MPVQGCMVLRPWVAKQFLLSCDAACSSTLPSGWVIALPQIGRLGRHLTSLPELLAVGEDNKDTLCKRH